MFLFFPFMSEIDLRILRLAPSAESQTALADELGFSIGKTHYVLKKLMEKGLIKAERFKRSDNKLGYRYVLTPSGLAERIRLTEAFIERKKQEYEALQEELQQIKSL